jgi:hypothetical protein
MAKYVVTAQLATFKTMTTEGPRVLHLMQGAPVPGDVTQESIDHHLSHDMIEALPEPEPVTVPAKAEVKADSATTHGGAAARAGANEKK